MGVRRTRRGGACRAPVEGASRAVERRHQYPDGKLLIYYCDLDRSEMRRKVKQELDTVPFITAVAEPRGYHLLLVQRDHHYRDRGE